VIQTRSSVGPQPGSRETYAPAVGLRMISTTLVSATPVPVPGPVASKTKPISFLTAPTGTKSVVPKDRIVYDCHITKVPAVTGTSSGVNVPFNPLNVKFLIFTESLTKNISSSSDPVTAL